MLEPERHVLHARAARTHRAFEFREHAPQGKQQRLHALGFRGKLEARAKARRRHVRHSRIGQPSHQSIERHHDLGTEAARDAFGRQLEHVAKAQHAKIGEPRERFLRPVEQEKCEARDAITQIGESQAAAHLQPARFGAREKPRSHGRRRDTESGVEAQLAKTALDRAHELRVPVEKSQARLDLERDPLPVQARHGCELPGPRREPLERLALRCDIARDHAQFARQRLRRRDRLAFANARR